MIKCKINSCFDLLAFESFFDAKTCGQLIEEINVAPSKPAEIYGRGESGAVDERMRKVTRLTPSPETVEFVREKLLEHREEIGQHFGISLGDCEEPQFLRYQTGDFFVAHQDGNTGLILLDKKQARRVSVVIFLNSQSEIADTGNYGGGALVFSDWRVNQDRREFPLAGAAGKFVAFRSETTHEVIPVTRGERYTIVSWFGEARKAEA